MPGAGTEALLDPTIPDKEQCLLKLGPHPCSISLHRLPSSTSPHHAMTHVQPADDLLMRSNTLLLSNPAFTITPCPCSPQDTHNPQLFSLALPHQGSPGAVGPVPVVP